MVIHVPTPLLPVMEQVQPRASSRQREGHAPLASEWVHEQVSIPVGLVCHSLVRVLITQHLLAM